MLYVKRSETPSGIDVELTSIFPDTATKKSFS